MRAYLWSTYLSYLTRSTCTSEIITDSVLKSSKSPCDTLSHPAPLERHVLINGSLYSSSTVVVQITQSFDGAPIVACWKSSGKNGCLYLTLFEPLWCHASAVDDDYEASQHTHIIISLSVSLSCKDTHTRRHAILHCVCKI